MLAEAKEAKAGLATVQAAADHLSVSKSHLYELMDKGQLPFIKLGKSRRIEWTELDQLIARNRLGGHA